VSLKYGVLGLLAELEDRARQEDRTDVVLMLRGAILHTEADLKWLDACKEDIQNWIRVPNRRA